MAEKSEKRVDFSLQRLHADACGEYLTIIKGAATVWQKMTEAEQARIISRLEECTEEVIRTVASAAISKAAEHVPLKIKGMIKLTGDQVELTATAAFDVEDWASIGRSIGHEVILVTGNVDDFVGERSHLQADNVGNLAMPRNQAAEIQQAMVPTEPQPEAPMPEPQPPVSEPSYEPPAPPSQPQG